MSSNHFIPTFFTMAFCFTATFAAAEGPAANDATPQSFMHQITIKDSTITINPGIYKTANGDIEVKTPATFTIAPGEIVTVKDEKILLSPDKPESWNKGTRLLGASDQGKVIAEGTFVEGSLTISKTPGGRKLVEGKHYLVSPKFGLVGLAPGSRISAKQPVYASYQYGLLRLDSIAVDSEGKAHLLNGKADLARPQQPELASGTKRLLNIFRPYHATVLTQEDIYPILERPDQAVTRTTTGRIPKTIAKIKRSEAVRIVCLGDSVTAGGDTSKPEFMYSEVFRRAIMDRYTWPSPHGVPFVSINVINLSYGGSCSSQWLRIGPLKNYLDEHPEMLGNVKERINFQRVLELKPDLVTVEFVNDVSFTKVDFEAIYGAMAEKLKAIGAEMILITPHFTALDLMSAKSMRTPETRQYVQFVYEFADKHNIGIADASSRWAHLWKEGIPYTTFLTNSFNHPDDKGHQMFADEIMKNFEEKK